MGKLSVPAVPQKADELTHDGLLFLLRVIGPTIYPSDLARARWHELVRAAERATGAWREASAAADTLRDAVPTWSRTNSRAHHKAAEKAAAADQKELRAMRAMQRAHDVAGAFYKAHIARSDLYSEPRIALPLAEAHP